MAEETKAEARDGDASAADVKSERAKLAEARYRVAAAAALVAGAFSVFLAGLMISTTCGAAKATSWTRPRR